jgi:hypothetical protein
MSFIIKGAGAYLNNLLGNISSSENINGLLTQAGDYLITESGDFLVWE